jgi:hypothetical protein
MIATAVSSVVANGPPAAARSTCASIAASSCGCCPTAGSTRVPGVAHDRAEGRLPELAPGEERRTRLEIRARRR